MAASDVVFTAVVKKSGVNPYVDLPERSARPFADGASRAVLVRVTDARSNRPPGRPAIRNPEPLLRIQRLTADGWFRTTVVPSRGGPFRLYLDTWMRRAAGLAVGDSARICLRPDPASRALSVPPELRKALSRDASARRRWESWPPSRRRESLSYLNFLQSPEARDRTVKKLMKILKSR